MNISVSNILQITRGRLLHGNPDLTIDHWCTDSRKLTASINTLFVAINGKNHDAHKFLAEVSTAGIRAFMVENEGDYSFLSQATVIKVEDSVDALQAIAAHHRATFHIPVIAITGSNGKTVVKEWLNQLLADDHRIVRSPRSYNSQLGVALSVLNMEDVHTLGIFEAGISQVGEMDRLRKVIQPDIGILTNIGQAHLENFSSRESLIAEKMKLFDGVPVAIVPHEFADYVPHGTKTISWGAEKSASLQVLEIQRSGNFADLHLVWQAARHHFILPYTDEASVQNALTCITALLQLGYTAGWVQSRLEVLKPVSMRLELLHGNHDNFIINDTYSNDIHSLNIALDVLQQHRHGRQAVVVLSDILQSGLEPQVLCRTLNELLQTRADRLIAVGPVLGAHKNDFTIPVTHFATTEALLAADWMNTLAHAVVLVKGARTHGFERIVAALQEKSHETVLEVNMNALVSNLNFFRGKLHHGVKTMVMVKAFGYGSGSHEIAGLLEFNKVDYLAVAYADEGVELRRHGISLPIMVMNAESSAIQAIVDHNLEPEIFSIRSLRAFGEATAHLAGKEFNIHLKCDTGMHRLGFESGHIGDAIHHLQRFPQLKVASVFTHLAATENPEHDLFTRQQLSTFDAMSDELMRGLGYSFMKHALNTGGIQRFPEAQYDMVRLGIGLYGVAPHVSEQGHLETVVTLKTIISQIKHLQKGESVGYNRRFVAGGPMKTATIPLGYADGLRRSLSNGVGEVLINGHRCPIVGNVCMDMTMVDVSHVEAKEGDSVIVFGADPTLHEFARRSGTIEYEILTAIGQRVKRVYVGE
ncbi:MAG: bifunctional UDP-N-acetylmuramoyl-tripeptide:D-alanyl-D-alanine ligase/alanine racemase [Flavobacteriales bacterium]|nr:bifunctional UDP-N-acetylmuramoyl-tripeptide:D-alanyl-D-alanine ligase/alanine racemase [Flavobacteriales bacterium]